MRSDRFQIVRETDKARQLVLARRLRDGKVAQVRAGRLKLVEPDGNMPGIYMPASVASAIKLDEPFVEWVNEEVYNA